MALLTEGGVVPCWVYKYGPPSGGRRGSLLASINMALLAEGDEVSRWVYHKTWGGVRLDIVDICT
jgi:hypothetical protein